MLKRDEQGNLVESYEGSEGILNNSPRADEDDMLATSYETRRRKALGITDERDLTKKNFDSYSARNKKYLDRVRNMSPVLESESNEHPLESERYTPSSINNTSSSSDERLKRLEIPNDRSRILSKTDQEWFWAKIEAEAAGGLGEYDQWSEQYLDSTGAFATKTGGRDETTTSASLWEANYTVGIQVNTYVKVWVERESDGDIIYLFTVGSASGFFPVLVWQDGGTTDGDKTHSCNRTYQARTIDATSEITGTKLGTGLTPLKDRWAGNYGLMNCPAATGTGRYGVGFYNSAGTFCLWDANEVLDTGDCT